MICSLQRNNHTLIFQVGLSKLCFDCHMITKNWDYKKTHRRGACVKIS